MKLTPEEGAEQLRIWRDSPFTKATPEMHDEAKRAALRAIGREGLMVIPVDERLIRTTDEQREVYEDIYDSVIRALMNSEI